MITLGDVGVIGFFSIDLGWLHVDIAAAAASAAASVPPLPPLVVVAVVVVVATGENSNRPLMLRVFAPRAS